jgi:predicted RNase H-like HicB family nuclease
MPVDSTRQSTELHCACPSLGSEPIWGQSKILKVFTLTPKFPASPNTETGRAKIVTMKYLVVVEESENGFGAYVPDLPGCVAVAESRAEVVQLIQEAIAIEIHIDDLQESGNAVPQPTSQGELVDVHAI